MCSQQARLKLGYGPHIRSEEDEPLHTPDRNGTISDREVGRACTRFGSPHGVVHLTADKDASAKSSAYERMGLVLTFRCHAVGELRADPIGWSVIDQSWITVANLADDHVRVDNHDNVRGRRHQQPRFVRGQGVQDC